MSKSFMSGYKTYDDSKGRGNPREWRNTFKERLTGEEAQAIMDEQDDSPHGILGIPITATQAEIKKAFKDLINKWHPDKNPNDPKAHEMAQKIIAAYTILNR
jgi:DnaJ-domain-containing protein 1